PDLHLEVGAGEVARLWLTNTANTRVFNVSVPGARMKLVGGDSGRVEHEELVESVLLAPSERAVVDLLADQPGELALEHHTPDRVYRLATITVHEGRAGSSAARAFEQLRRAPELAAERQQLDRWLAAPPDKVLALVAQMDDPAAMPASAGPVTYACPMHPEVTSDQPGRCPKCGMKLLAVGPGAQAHTAMAHSHMDHGDADGIEWEDDMVEVNRATTAATMHWRFLVLDRDGVVEPNLVWKDTVLVRTGQVVDILFDVTNPGLWMAHCHIAEHMQSGMMFSFNVAREGADR
ncbi:MAG TPA: multicopper oxidase family protein, partial [Actinomycetota bacterium]